MRPGSAQHPLWLWPAQATALARLLYVVTGDINGDGIMTGLPIQN